jgi:hypothetical protein
LAFDVVDIVDKLPGCVEGSEVRGQITPSGI